MAQGPRHRFLQLAGPTGPRRIHFTDWGPRRRKRAILCVHGYSGNARDFDALAAAFAHDTRVICIDVAGRGESDWLGSALEYNFSRFLADIDAVVASLGLREIDWVGTSMGGLLGMLHAARPGSNVRRLVMNDVGAYVPLDGLLEIAGNLDAPARFATLDDVQAHLRHARREWGEVPEALWQPMARHAARPADGGFTLRYDPKIATLMHKVPASSGLFFWGPWAQVSCPVLVVRGEHSCILPRAVAEAMAGSKRNARLEQVPGCGHAPSLMAESHIAIVREFLCLPSSSSRASSRTPKSSRPGPPRFIRLPSTRAIP